MKSLKEYQAKYGKLEGEKQDCIDRAWAIQAEQECKKRKPIKNNCSCSTTLKKGTRKTTAKKAVDKKQSVKKVTTKKATTKTKRK